MSWPEAFVVGACMIAAAWVAVTLLRAVLSCREEDDE